jgi:hypothetical protein
VLSILIRPPASSQNAPTSAKYSDIIRYSTANFPFIKILTLIEGDEACDFIGAGAATGVGAGAFFLNIVEVQSVIS